MRLVDLLPPEAWTPAKADAPERIAALERRLGRALPPDLKELHLTCANVCLDDGGHAFLTLEEIDSIAALQLGDRTDDWAPRTWIGVIDCLDGSYVGVDLVPNGDGTHNWLDCGHESVGDVAVIATSLVELLRRMLAHRGGRYWLAAGAGPFPRIVHARPR